MMIKQLAGLGLSLLLLAGCQQTTEPAAEVDQGEGKTSGSFPTRTVRIVVPYEAGGGSDVTARKLAEIITKKGLLPGGDPIVVNLPGSNTRSGLQEVMNADPDGHTILLHHSSLNSMNALDMIDISHDDFQIVSQIAESPLLLVGSSDSEWTTFQEYVDAAKADPRSVRVGLPGLGPVSHLAYEYFTRVVGVNEEFAIVPYTGGAGATTALMGGQVDMRMSATLDAVNYAESGDIIPLVTTSYEKHPHPLLKEATTMKELGIDFDLNLMYGIYAPKGIPDDRLAILANAFEEAVNSEEFQEYGEAMGLEPLFREADEYADLHDKHQAIFDDIAKEIQVE
ncbi:tripartite tricarboxylate transporter substrate binding protein [Shouchella clausii]|uniref:tripartite tricarboxylate transporter substrate binding protein n=1 Tax=Shouchella clausii TaxID=79880 RepID=UPI00270F81F3|nr:tripartite tricarboxylate transporter substrate binding protein [Shouchella clausii]MDO7268705.1 tripartite tricarboxylate transporter substrate binding protein [Shouchella clausii]MDO7289080.1 tripartite tricarboxylate transporter substrate binding protein [Shouchella clausii]